MTTLKIPWVKSIYLIIPSEQSWRDPPPDGARKHVLSVAINFMHIPGPALLLFSHTDSEIEIFSSQCRRNNCNRYSGNILKKYIQFLHSINTVALYCQNYFYSNKKSHYITMSSFLFALYCVSINGYWYHHCFYGWRLGEKHGQAQVKTLRLFTQGKKSNQKENITGEEDHK